MVMKIEVLNDFPRFFSILIVELAAADVVNLTLKMKRDMIIENLDLEPKINSMMWDFLKLKPSVSSIPEDLHMDADSAPDEQVHSSDDEDIGNDHIPKVNLKQDWWKPLLEEDRPATPEPA
ncbi:hypothetical protein Tco_1311214 [Tanacetum coccineum]